MSECVIIEASVVRGLLEQLATIRGSEMRGVVDALERALKGASRNFLSHYSERVGLNWITLCITGNAPMVGPDFDAALVFLDFCKAQLLEGRIRVELVDHE